MTTPTRSTLKIDKYLTDYGVGYSQNIKGRFIANRAGYVHKVDSASDYYPIWNKADWFRSEMTKVGRHEPSPAAHPRLSNDTFFCDEYRLHTTINKKDLAEDEVGLREAKVAWLIEQALLARDKEVASVVFGTGLWTSNTEQTGVASGPTGAQFLQWNDSSSTPVADVYSAKESVRSGCGHEANVMVISVPVKNALLQHADILAYQQYTTGGAVTLDQLKGIFGMDDIIIGAAVENSAAEGATATMADVFGKHALFLYVPPTMTRHTAKPITVFSWSQFDAVDENSAAIRTWEIDNPASEALEAEQAFDVKITANDAGVFYKDAVA